MKKKIQILVTFILALAVSVGLFAGCNKTEKVTVTLKATETVETGAYKNLTATASDGSELEWKSNNTAIVTVEPNSNGKSAKITGVKAGTATVTATVKGGKANASCEVTVKDKVLFTYTADGNPVENKQITVKWEETTQLTATASDNSTITKWQSVDTSVVTVSETGLVTAVNLGETEINVTTSTAAKDTLKVIVENSDDPNKYTITTTEVVDKWYYYARSDGGRELQLNTAEYRDGVVTFDFGGSANWNSDDMFLAIKKSDVADEGVWHRLNMKIKSSIATTLTINDTRVDLIASDNDVSVCYQQWEFASAMIQFGNGEAGTAPREMKIVVSEVGWEDFAPVDLQTPEFTLQGDEVAINDTKNTEGVHSYQIGLFEDGNDEPIFTQPIRGKNGTLDTSSATKNGEFTVKIMAKGNLGFNDSAWSDTTVKYTVTNADTPYTITDPSGAGYGGGASAALVSGKWEYFTIKDEGASCKEAKYENGTLTFDGHNGYSADSVQLLRHFGQYAEGTKLEITMTLTSSVAGDIMVCGEKVSLEANVERQVTVTVEQTAGKPTITIILDTLAEDHASKWPNKQKDPNSLPDVDVVFTVSGLSVKIAQPAAE